MSSKPKIIIGTKKKKKKPLLIVSKKKKSVAAPRHDGASSSAKASSSAAGRPPSPNTVTAAAAAGVSPNNVMDHVTLPTKKHPTSKKSKAGAILIKPFEKPPELPTDFYDSSLEVLTRALTCVLRHEALTAPNNNSSGGDNANANNNNNNNNSRRLIGREELYRSVEDLCVHKFGSRLYYDVVQIMEKAAGEVVRRLADNTTADGGELLDDDDDVVIVDGNTGDVGYNASRLIGNLNLKDGGCNYNPNTTTSAESEVELRYSEKRYALLRKMHVICRASYADEYLTFVRSIFLALDRAYVYFANVDLDQIGNAVGSGGNNAPPGGKVLERTSASASFGNKNDGSATRVWGLWEVGIACLRNHMLRRPVATRGLATMAPGGGADSGVFPALTTMVLTTAYAILSEYDNSNQSFSSSMQMGDVRPLVRNCVRTIIDLGALPSLLEELIIVALARFNKEGKWWSSSLNESERSAPEFLLHVKNRLRQSQTLCSYYLPMNAASSAALRMLATLPCLTGAVRSSSSSILTPSSVDERVVWSPANNSTRRMLPSIIEKQLLGPHLGSPTSGILVPRHLYPLLDDDDGSSSISSEAWKTHSGSAKTYANAKRLYGLCWRMTISMPPPELDSNGTTPSPSTSQSALEYLRKAFGEYGRIRGAEIVKQGLSNSNNSKEMEKRVVPDLLALKNHLYSLHAIAFRSDESFGSMVRSILEDVLNGAVNTKTNGDGDGGRRIAELLAKHVDARFKDAKASAAVSNTATGGPTMVSAAISTDANETFQSQILLLFRHIHSKDVFEAFYKRDLAKRLLTGRSVSTDMEKSFLSKLKAECGAGYTSKMEGMFKDMELSRDIMGSYAAHASSLAVSVPSGSSKTVDMDVQVLTTGYWPVYPKYPNIILPSELLSLRTKFETYYNDKYQGRRITWQYSLGNCIVKANFPKCPAPKELIVNVCQSLVLLCFKTEDGEDGTGLSLEEITKKTGIEDRSELERVLQSLSLGRDGTRVLRKVDYDSPTVKSTPSPSKSAASKNADGSPRKSKPKPRLRRNVGPHDRFIFNPSFTSNQRRIRITNITMKETSEERSKTHATVSKDRLYFIDAAVVRIMKARKTIDHRALIGEVMAQLKFPTTSSDIKKRIESLIEREYMERVEGDRSRYKYLA